jgi:hypothetical protein
MHAGTWHVCCVLLGWWTRRHVFHMRWTTLEECACTHTLHPHEQINVCVYICMYARLEHEIWKAIMKCRSMPCLHSWPRAWAREPGMITWYTFSWCTHPCIGARTHCLESKQQLFPQNFGRISCVREWFEHTNYRRQDVFNKAMRPGKCLQKMNALELQDAMAWSRLSATHNGGHDKPG